MEKIDIEKLVVGNVINYDKDGKAASGYNGTEQSIKMLAEKINEMIDTIRSEIHPNF